MEEEGARWEGGRHVGQRGGHGGEGQRSHTEKEEEGQVGQVGEAGLDWRNGVTEGAMTAPHCVEGKGYCRR